MPQLLVNCDSEFCNAVFFVHDSCALTRISLFLNLQSCDYARCAFILCLMLPYSVKLSRKIANFVVEL